MKSKMAGKSRRAAAAQKVTRRLAEFAAGLRYRDLPGEVVVHAKTAVLNILAAALGGAQLRIGRTHLALARELGGGSREATLLGDGGRVSRAAAAYANGSLAFALDYEDVCNGVIHAGPIIVPAALAVAESLHASGRDFLAGMTAGYESGTRIGLSMQPSPERGARVWGQQYTPFGACAAAGNLLGLDAVAMDAAFGIAGTYAPVPSAYKYFGIVAQTRPMREAKLGWGWMAMAGTMGAISAKAGLRGGHGILDGDEGFWIMSGSDRVDQSQVVRGLGREWLLLGTKFKLHPSIAWNHPAHIALRQLLDEHDFGASDVAKVRVHNVGATRIADQRPAGAVDAQFSLPYTVATTLLREPLTPRLYDERKIASARLRSLMAKVECLPDPKMEFDWFDTGQMRTRVQLTLKNGQRLERAICFPDDRPPYSKDDVLAKLHAMSDGLLSNARIARIIETVDRLERLDDVATLARLLVPSRKLR